MPILRKTSISLILKWFPVGPEDGSVAQMGSTGRILSVSDIKTCFNEFYAKNVI